MGDTWITDLTCFDGIDDSPEAPARALRLVDYFRRIVMAAWNLGPQVAYTETDIKCRRRPGRKPCRGKILVLLHADDRIHWHCGACDDQGIISNFHDYASKSTENEAYPLFLAEDQWKYLVDLTQSMDLSPSIRGALRDEDGYYCVSLSMERLDELWCLLSDVMDLTEDNEELQMLEEIQNAIGFAMDGC